VLPCRGGWGNFSFESLPGTRSLRTLRNGFLYFLYVKKPHNRPRRQSGHQLHPERKLNLRRLLLEMVSALVTAHWRPKCNMKLEALHEIHSQVTVLGAQHRGFSKTIQIEELVFSHL